MTDYVGGGKDQALIQGRVAYGINGSNAYPILVDADGKLITSGAGAGAVDFKGTWNAATNVTTPLAGAPGPLSDGGGGGVKGDYYRVAVAGSTSVDGETDWKVNDYIVNEGSAWSKIDNTQDLSLSVLRDGSQGLTADWDAGLFKITIEQLEMSGAAVTTENVFNAIGINGLTTGGIINAVSNSADTSPRILATIHNDNVLATGTTVLKLIQDNITGPALNIVSGTLVSTGSGFNVQLATLASGGGATVNLIGATATTGAGSPLNLRSGGGSTSGLIQILSGSSTSGGSLGGDIILETGDGILNAGQVALRAVGTGGTPLGKILLSVKKGVLNAAAGELRLACDNFIELEGDTNITGNVVITSTATTVNILDIPNADSLTTASIINAVSNSASAATRTLVLIHNDNAAAVGTVPFKIIQDANQAAMVIDNNGLGNSLVFDGPIATAAAVISILNPLNDTASVFSITGANNLSTGGLIDIISASGKVTVRSLVKVHQNSVAAVNAIGIEIIQDSTALALKAGGDVFISDNLGIGATVISLAVLLIWFMVI